MEQKPQDERQSYEQEILQRLQSAQQRAQQARDEQMYYRGQSDALSDMLSAIRNFTSASGQAIVSPLPQNPPVTVTSAAPAPEETIAEPPKRRGRKKKAETSLLEQMPLETTPKKRGRKPAMPPVPKTIYQVLAREAIDLKVLTRKASWFYHQLLPHGLIKGLSQLEKMLEENTAFREAIQAACDEKKAFAPADEPVIDGESAPEQSEVMIGESAIEQPEVTTDESTLAQPMASTAEPTPEQVVVVTEKKRRGRQKRAETSPTEEPTPKKRGRKPAATPVPKVSESQQLAREAVDLGVFTRKASWFYHKLLPQGLIKGLYQLEKALERDATLREAIQAACAEKKAFVPADEPVIVIEPVSEPVLLEAA